MVLGSGIGGLETIEIQHQRLLDKGPDKVSAFTIPKLIGNAASAQLSIQYGLRGPNQVVVTACASATNAIGDSYKLIRDDEVDVVITGGSEAALTHIGLSAFAAMRALSERNDDPTHASRPFDRDRDGFVLSEGAGLLVLEELEHAKARGAHIYGEMYGYGVSCDGGHITAPDKDGVGAAYAMSQAIKDARINPERHRLHQRPRHQHPAGRRGRNHRHQERLRGPRPQGQHLEHEEPAWAISWAPAAAWNWCLCCWPCATA